MSVFADIISKIKGSSQTDVPDTSGPLSEIEDVNDQSNEERKLVEFVKGKIDYCRQRNTRTSLEANYLTNICYLMGFDGIYYDPTYRQFKNVDQRRRQVRNRFKVNKILPTIQNRLSRLTVSPPKYDIRPESNSQEDKDAARLGLQVLENVFEKQLFDQKRQELVMSTMQGGHAYVQASWDPSLGKPMSDPDTGDFAGYEGDIRLDVLNCLEVFPDPLAKNLEEAGFIVKAKVRKLDYFRERYPDRGNAVKEEDAWLLSSIYDMKANALSTVGITGSSTSEQMKNSAIEIVYYEKRSSKHPNGRMVCIAAGVLLEDKELPIGEYDIVKFDDIMIGGRYGAEAVITHLRPIQDRYNIARQKMADWVQKLLAGKWIAARGHNLGQEAMTNESGEFLEYDPVPGGEAPQAIQVPVIPAYAYKELETMDAEFDYISGINEISRGVLPSASIPAAGMAFLQEQDQTRIGVQTTRNEIGYAKVGKNVLKYVSKFYVMPRMLKEAGDDLSYAVKDFVGADIKDNHDVIVIQGSTIPESKVLRNQSIMNAYTGGLLGNPMDPKVRTKVLKATEFGDIAEVWQDQALKEAQWKRMKAMIEAGDQQNVIKSLNEFDDQQFHLVEMNLYRISEKFLTLDDDKQKLFMWVMEWRLQSLVNINNPAIPQQQQMAQQMLQNIQLQIAQGALAGSPLSPLNAPVSAFNSGMGGGPPMLPGQPGPGGATPGVIPGMQPNGTPPPPPGIEAPQQPR